MKRLVVCCDGTWNNDDLQTEDTNVARMARAVHGSEATGGVLQIVLYIRGVGTTGLKLETFVEGATGLGIDDNIRSAYQFIAQNYIPGDEIFLFGFSRGAFTARSLSGLISACSILKRQSLGSLPDAWAYYRTDRPHSPVLFTKWLADEGKDPAEFHLDVTIKFLGVWDTVGSLGIPGSLLTDSNKKKFAFHDTSPSPIVKTAVHAMAVDEHRHNFTPTYWTGVAPAGVTIKQVWFAGAHADVGGGYKNRTLADIPLVFIARQAEAVGLALDWSCLPTSPLDVTAPSHNSSSGLFALDHFRPTLREISGRKCDVALNESLFVPVDENGEPIQTINEMVHRSVIERYGKPAQLCANDEQGLCRLEPYLPKTLKPFIGPNGFSGLPVVD
ncbi:DUF2235 domain-containing protein [Methylobacterium sp. J-070]|uniref:DUF2235 domain-containing protein n=1 Tax=Methylobacterium sp. J-070 TaxID=2836650 RepID=UPI001FBB7AF8|nr:DUF2235 domain-containing protein [Methylobacterium sp. J-070]MCJ2054467.1 DUF2235 domain-containing protein [Methylobacterium sp. J-070]